MSTISKNTRPDSNLQPIASTLKLQNFLPFRIEVLSSVVSRAIFYTYSRHGLELTEWQVLDALGRFGELTATQVSNHYFMLKTSVSRATKTLIKRQLISRRTNEDDRREAFLALTREGQHVYAECSPRFCDLTRDLEEAIAPEDRPGFERILAMIARRVEQ